MERIVGGGLGDEVRIQTQETDGMVPSYCCSRGLGSVRAVLVTAGATWSCPGGWDQLSRDVDAKGE